METHAQLPVPPAKLVRSCIDPIRDNYVISIKLPMKTVKSQLQVMSHMRILTIAMNRPSCDMHTIPHTQFKAKSAAATPDECTKEILMIGVSGSV